MTRVLALFLMLLAAPVAAQQFGGPVSYVSGLTCASCTLTSPNIGAATGTVINATTKFRLNGVDALQINGTYLNVYDADGGTALFLGGASSPVNIYRSRGQHLLQNAAGDATYGVFDSTGLSLPKLGADPGAGPGAGLIRLYAIQGTGSACTLRIQAGTSATAASIATDVGTGC